MTLIKSFFAYTDYPIEELGDEPYKNAPTREVEVLAYDRDKYATVKVKGTNVVVSFKAGYLYAYANLSKRPSLLNLYSLPTSDDGKAYTRKQATEHLKKLRKRKTTYTVYFVGGSRKEYSNFGSALNAFASKYRTSDISLCKTVSKRYSWHNEAVIESLGGAITILTGYSNQSVFKNRHYRKYICR